MIGTYYRLSLADEDVGADKVESNSMYHVSQRTAGKLFYFSCCLDIRSERFKAGTVLDFRHSASPIYIL